MLVFAHQLAIRMRRQRRIDSSQTRAIRWYHTADLVVRENHLLPAIVSIILAIVQIFNTDPNKVDFFY